MRPSLVLAAFLATVAMNAAANLLPLNGRTTGEISDQFQVFITPAGYVFSIWSLIYLGLGAYVVWQFTSAGRSSPRTQGLARLFIVTCIANIAWLELWHYGEYVLTLAAMLALLAALVIIYLRLQNEPPVSTAERWCVDGPFSLYLGWITVATLVNLSVVLDIVGRPIGLDAASWALAMIVLATLIGIVMGWKRRDIVYVAVIAWALEGVALKAGQPAQIVYAAWAGTAITAVLALWLLRSRMHSS